jgi:hypothetical protein
VNHLAGLPAEENDKLKFIGPRTSATSKVMWDKKRQLAWILGGLIIGTYISYSDSLDENGKFVLSFFIFMESLVLIIMAVLFWLYSRRK